MRLKSRQGRSLCSKGPFARSEPTLEPKDDFHEADARMQSSAGPSLQGTAADGRQVTPPTDSQLIRQNSGQRSSIHRIPTDRAAARRPMSQNWNCSSWTESIKLMPPTEPTKTLGLG